MQLNGDWQPSTQELLDMIPEFLTDDPGFLMHTLSMLTGAVRAMNQRLCELEARLNNDR